MQTTTEQTGTITREGERVIVVGHVRVANRLQLKELVFEALAEYGHATIDLHDAAYIDASGVAALIAVAQYAAFARKDLVIASATPEFRDVIGKTLPTVEKLFRFVDEAPSA